MGHQSVGREPKRNHAVAGIVPIRIVDYETDARLPGDAVPEPGTEASKAGEKNGCTLLLRAG